MEWTNWRWWWPKQQQKANCMSQFLSALFIYSDSLDISEDFRHNNIVVFVFCYVHDMPNFCALKTVGTQILQKYDQYTSS